MKNRISDLQFIWTDGDTRINGEIFGHHHSLLQCSRSSVVQDDGGARISGEIFLIILAKYITVTEMVT
jgi:hypothetical protein